MRKGLNNSVFRHFFLLCIGIFFSVIPAFSVDLSAGAGVSLASIFAFTEEDGKSANDTVSGVGVCAFADATYAQIGVGVLIYQDTSYMNVSFLFKYPFEFADLLIFPLAGGEYRYNLDYSEASFYTVKVGLGADFSVTDTIYLRPTLLIGYAFLSNLEDDRIKAYEEFGGGSIRKICMDISASVGYRF